MAMAPAMSLILFLIRAGAAASFSDSFMDKAECSDYLRKTGCGWTSEYNCPGQRSGSKGVAGSKDTIGYKCCCQVGAWKLPASAPDDNAFNLDHPMGQGYAGQPLIHKDQDNGLAIQVGPGQQSGDNVASNRNPDAFPSHAGANTYTERFAHTNPSFVATEHHGPIHNKLSHNNAKTEKEKCPFGICADLEGDEPSMTNPQLPQTQHGTPGMPTDSSEILPSYEATMDDGDDRPKLTKLMPLGSAQANAAASPPLGPAAPLAAREVSHPATLPTVPGTPMKAEQANEAVPVPVKSSGGYGALVALGIICLVCMCGGSVAACVLIGRKKKVRSVDANAHFNRDVVNRQPIYHDVPSHVVDVEAAEVRMQHGAGGDVGLSNAELHYQRGAVQSSSAVSGMPVTMSDGVSFPGMPTIGGNNLLSTSSRPLAPMAFNMTRPHGSYQPLR